MINSRHANKKLHTSKGGKRPAPVTPLRESKINDNLLIYRKNRQTKNYEIGEKKNNKNILELLLYEKGHDKYVNTISFLNKNKRILVSSTNKNSLCITTGSCKNDGVRVYEEKKEINLHPRFENIRLRNNNNNKLNNSHSKDNISRIQTNKRGKSSCKLIHINKEENRGNCKKCPEQLLKKKNNELILDEKIKKKIQHCKYYASKNDNNSSSLDLKTNKTIKYGSLKNEKSARNRSTMNKKKTDTCGNSRVKKNLWDMRKLEEHKLSVRTNINLTYNKFIENSSNCLPHIEHKTSDQKNTLKHYEEEKKCNIKSDHVQEEKERVCNVNQKEVKNNKNGKQIRMNIHQKFSKNVHKCEISYTQKGSNRNVNLKRSIENKSFTNGNTTDNSSKNIESLTIEIQVPSHSNHVSECRVSTILLNKRRMNGEEMEKLIYQNLVKEHKGTLGTQLKVGATSRCNVPSGNKLIGNMSSGSKPNWSKPNESKPSESKPSESKPSESKPSESKPSESKPSESKPSESKPSESKPSESKPSESKPNESKPSENKPSESKPSESKPNEIKPSDKIRICKEAPKNCPKKKKKIDRKNEYQKMIANKMYKILIVKNNSKEVGNYIITRRIGKGTFGKVCLGIHMHTYEMVAIKILNKNKLLNLISYDKIMKEIEIHRKIDHNHICKFYEVHENKNNLYMILEYLPKGDLLTYIYEKKKINEDSARTIFYQLISAIDYLHKNNIVHRDLKPENILLDYNENVKLIDFGLSTIYRKNSLLTTSCGSPYYTSPEILLGNKYHAELTDVWSLGVIIFLLLNRKLPFNHNDIHKLFQTIIKGILHFELHVSVDAKHLIQNMLNVNFKKRYTLHNIKSHIWYTNHNMKKIKNIMYNSEKGCNLMNCNTCLYKIIIEKGTYYNHLIITKICKIYRLNHNTVFNEIKNEHMNFIKTAYHLFLNKTIRMISKHNYLYSHFVLVHKNSNSFSPNTLVPPLNHDKFIPNVSSPSYNLADNNLSNILHNPKIICPFNFFDLNKNNSYHILIQKLLDQQINHTDIYGNDDKSSKNTSLVSSTHKKDSVRGGNRCTCECTGNCTGRCTCMHITKCRYTL
ncbi:serine/threonine protein kinase KIN, putative [Plasmodium malariae]|uniref:Serine/threonine protein kinase KIN, putative n=1 Tax=Plasmodium malariae TaxID=5858 RepID=A0A1D3SQU7_PLAMA|nr:serine/threonine protein kinase KIN, putative [Plasmodium malariae]SCO94030.1 serine/threonine protein kinase KIN, putative [Plasmodium malariae]